MMAHSADLGKHLSPSLADVFEPDWRTAMLWAGARWLLMQLLGLGGLEETLEHRAHHKRQLLSL